jgi:hypothetical protein
MAARFAALFPFLDERQRRMAAAVEARVLGHGGIGVAARASGLTPKVVSRGIVELESGVLAVDFAPGGGRVRRAGAGRKPAEVADPGLVAALSALVKPTERGDPESLSRWTTLSTRDMARQLTAAGHQVAHTTVGQLLRGAGFVLRGNAKVLEGSSHPDRDAQFGHINDLALAFAAAGDPVVSVDAKKKEMIGNLANPGLTWHRADAPVKVRDHDFLDPELGKAIPYGVYDLGTNTGWVNVGVDHDTAVFAVESIRRWWKGAGRGRYPQARRLLVTADAGGSNATVSRGFKTELAALALETGLAITVCHYPPGTSKWNRIEHRLFSAITHNWRGQPLTSLHVVIEAIGATTTTTGLTVTAELDTGAYPTGREISDAQFAGLPLDRDPWHGDWNYTLRPEPPAPPAPPVTPRPDTTWLHHREVTGMTDTQWDALVRYLQPPAPPTGSRGRPPGASLLSTQEKLLATALQKRHRLTQVDIGTLLGVRRGIIAHTVPAVVRTLATLGQTLIPAATPLRTIPALTAALTQ